MYKNRQRFLTGWRAGRTANLIKVALDGRTATKPGRKLAGAELEAAKRRLLEQYRPNQQPEPQPADPSPSDATAAAD